MYNNTIIHNLLYMYRLDLEQNNTIMKDQHQLILTSSDLYFKDINFLVFEKIYNYLYPT